MSKAEFEFVDRYSATGTPYPDPASMCVGQCEGMGCYPHYVSSANEVGGLQLDEIPRETPQERAAWQAAHDAPDAHKQLDGGKCDGWHFIKCPDCEGSGKRNVPTAEGEQPSPIK